MKANAGYMKINNPELKFALDYLGVPMDMYYATAGALSEEGGPAF
jgi:hypothetical protein